MDKRFWVKLALGVVFGAILFLWLGPYFAGVKSLRPVLLHWGQLTVYWYGLLIALGVLAGYVWLVVPLAHRRRLDQEKVLLAVIWGLIGGIIGARLLFVMLKWPLYAGDFGSILAVSQGGLSVHGALLGGVIAIWFYAVSQRISFAQLCDVFAPAAMLGQVIGRFGNFFNQEAFGGPTNLPWKMFVAPEFRPPQFASFNYFHPTFLYEALGGALILIGLLKLFAKPLPAGSIVAWYLILYSSLRFLIEFFRVDSDVWGWLTVAQWGSLAIIVVGVYVLWRIRYER
ncbi:MAG: prolipoprotein diacylglyceryl transferase [bacterium]